MIKFITLPKVTDDSFLIFGQSLETIPFSIQRIYYILHANTKLSRGFHAHHKTIQVLFCIQGSIEIVLDDGRHREQTKLDKPEVGILLDRMVWHEMHSFQEDTILLVLASEKYNPDDYIRDYEQFKQLTNG